MELNEKMFEVAEKITAGSVIALSVVVKPRTAVYSPISELRNPVYTHWVQLA
jgi:hypothetical protein